MSRRKSWRGNGDQIGNWIVEMVNFSVYLLSSSGVYADDQLNITIKDNKMIPYFEKMRQLLSLPWSILINSDVKTSRRILVKMILTSCVFIVRNNDGFWAKSCRHRNEFNLAESHCQRALSWKDGSRGKKTSLLINAFTSYGDLRSLQDNYTDAAILWKHNCGAITYIIQCILVQTAAGNLIE
jgi:hypothetical protein